jgi:hypothetical protein
MNGVNMRRTHVQLIADALKQFPNHRASPASLEATLGWPTEKFEKALQRAKDDPSSAIQTGPGGVIKYLGTERNTGGGGVGLYADVTRVVRDHWAPKELGARQIEMFNTSQAGRRGAGEWTHPDLVLACYPRRRPSRDSVKDLHAFEVETADGFSIKSIYQAHAQAHGADFAWVFTFSGGVDKGDRHERIQWAARETGVGLVEFDRPGASGTYRKLLTPRRLEASANERLAFVTRVLGHADDSDLMAGLTIELTGRLQ